MTDLPTPGLDDVPQAVIPVSGPASATVREIRVFDVLDSTNRYAMDLARSGPDHRCAVVARHQVAGRGRLGRRWQAPAGANVLLSVIVDDEIAESSRFLVGPALSLAAVHAVGRLGVRASLKWPNDLVDEDGRKLGGVLVESEHLPDGRQALVAGIGVNVGWPAPGDELEPDEGTGAPVAPTPPVSLAMLGLDVAPDDLVPDVLEGFAERLAHLVADGDPRVVFDEMVVRCVTIGQAVDVHRARDTVSGIASGIDDAGHLAVDTDGGPVTVATGDVVHLRNVPG